MSSQVLMHPGAIGLTLLHAFAYGLPVITHNDAKKHGPEFVAFSDGETGYAFARGSVDELGLGLEKIIGNQAIRERMAKHCAELLRTRFTTEKMAQNFMKILY
jgi:glycosyltransferase involved in cell wall biosynthesis